MNVSRDQLKVVALAAVLVVSAVVITPGMLFGPSGDASEAKSGEVYTQTEVPQAGPDAGRYESASLMSLPDGYTETTTEDASAPPEVRASAGAQTMQVTVTQRDGEVALQLEDDRVHDGRWVSIPAQWFEAELGSVPEVAYVDHSSGETYQTDLYTRDDSVAFYVEEFSTNTVTFSGEVAITGNFSDGASTQYDLTDYDSASDPVVNLTGVLNTEWDNESAAGVGVTSTQSVSIGGNKAPTDGAGGDPVLEVTANAPSATYNPFYDEGDGAGTSWPLVGDHSSNTPWSSGIQIQPDTSGPIQKLTVNIDSADGTDYSPKVDIRVSSGGADSDFSEGTLVKSDWAPDWSAGPQTITLDSSYEVTAGNTYTLEFQTAGSNNDGSSDRLYLDKDDSASTTWYTYKYDGTASSKSFYGSVDVTINDTVENLGVTTDTGESASFGTISDNETTTATLPVNTGTTELSWSGSGTGTIDYTLKLQEQTQTVDPSVELNSTTKTVAGTLNESETAQVTFNQSVLQEGTNQLNVSVGDGTLSSDAPTPTVGVELTHDAVDKQSVDYGGGQWTETYNVSETYASSRASAELTVPFQSNVYQIQNIDASINGSSWSSVAASNYNLSETTLTVDLTGVYGGDIPEGTEMRVRTTGTAVDVIAGTIQVTNPTAPGQPLNSTVDIVDWGPDSALDISGTPRGDRVHYVSEATFTPDEYSDFEGDGTHVLHLPNGSADNTFTVRTLPLRMAPKSGDIHVSVPDGRVNTTEPVYRVTPGDSVGDAYDVTFTNASDGEDYVLWSETNEIVVDSGTASSPLTLSDDEDNLAVLQFMLDDGTASSTSDGGSDSGGAPLPMPTTGGDTNFLPLIGLAVAGGLVVVASRNDGAVVNTGANAAESIEGSLGRIPIAGPALGKGLGGLVESIASLLEAVVGNQTIALGIVGAMLVGAVQGGIIEVPQSSLTLIVVAGVGIYSLVALREFGEFSTERWAALLAATTVVAVQSLSSASLLTAIVESDVWPILAITLAFLAWRGVQGLNTPDQVTNVQLDTKQNDNDDEDGNQ